MLTILWPHLYISIPGRLYVSNLPHPIVTLFYHYGHGTVVTKALIPPTPFIDDP